MIKVILWTHSFVGLNYELVLGEIVRTMFFILIVETVCDHSHDLRDFFEIFREWGE